MWNTCMKKSCAYKQEFTVITLKVSIFLNKTSQYNILGMLKLHSTQKVETALNEGQIELNIIF